MQDWTCHSAQLIKSPLWRRLYPFGLSQVGRGGNGHQQKAMNSDVIYGRGTAGAAEWIISRNVAALNAASSRCSRLHTCTSRHPSQAWPLPNPPSCCRTFNGLYQTPVCVSQARLSFSQDVRWLDNCGCSLATGWWSAQGGVWTVVFSETQ